MQDLELARKRLTENSLTLCIVKDGRALFETASHGITGFLDAIQKLQGKLKGTSVADRVAGKAIALLCAYAKVKAVYALTLSQKAQAVFQEMGIRHEWQSVVENILDNAKSGTCPFEKLAAEITDPTEAYEKLRALQTALACKG